MRIAICTNTESCPWNIANCTYICIVCTSRCYTLYTCICISHQVVQNFNSYLASMEGWQRISGKPSQTQICHWATVIWKNLTFKLLVMWHNKHPNCLSPFQLGLLLLSQKISNHHSWVISTTLNQWHDDLK